MWPRRVDYSSIALLLHSAFYYGGFSVGIFSPLVLNVVKDRKEDLLCVSRSKMPRII